jgi:hypothetical protein
VPGEPQSESEDEHHEASDRDTCVVISGTARDRAEQPERGEAETGERAMNEPNSQAASATTIATARYAKSMESSLHCAPTFGQRKRQIVSRCVTEGTKAT